MSASSLASGSSSRRPDGPSTSSAAVVISASQQSRRTSHRSRRPKPPSASTTPVHPSPLRSQAPVTSGASSTATPRATSPVAGPGPSSARRAVERSAGGSAGNEDSAETTPYISPVDRSLGVFHPAADPYEGEAGDEAVKGDAELSDHDNDGSSASDDGSADSAISLLLPHNPPTPNLADISLHSLRTDSFFANRQPGSPPLASAPADGGLTPYSAIADHRTTRSSRTSSSSDSSSATARPSAAAGLSHPGQEGSQTSPPGYSPLDPVVYASGVPTDLPASVISAAFEAEDRAEAAARARAAAAGAAVLASAEGDAGRAGAGVGGGVVDGVLRWWRGGPQGADASPA